MVPATAGAIVGSCPTLATSFLSFFLTYSSGDPGLRALSLSAWAATHVYTLIRGCVVRAIAGMGRARRTLAIAPRLDL